MSPHTTAPATPETLRRLARHGYLRSEQLEHGLQVLRDARGHTWQAFAERPVLWGALTLIVVGVVFFFAANWQGMGRLERTGLAALPHILAVVATIRLGLNRPAGRVAAAAAATLIGPALLTYGQAYQTGANACQLFVGWAALAAPFAVLIDSAWLWLLCTVLLRVGLYFFVDESVTNYGDRGTFMALAAAAVLAWDAGSTALAFRRGRASLARALAVLGAASVLLPLNDAVTTWRAGLGEHTLFGVAVGLHIAMLAGLARARDVLAFTTWMLSACVHLGFAASEVVLTRNNEVWGLFKMGAVVFALGCALAASTTVLLLVVRRGQPAALEHAPLSPDAPTLQHVLDAIGGPRAAETAAHFFETHAPPAIVRPWYVQGALSAVLWVAAAFFTGALFAIDAFESGPARLLCGLGFAVIAVAGSRVRAGFVRLNLALIGYAGATGFLFLFFEKAGHLRNGDTAVAILVVQVLAACFIACRPVRFKAAIGAQFALVAVLVDHLETGYASVVMVLGTLFVLAWLLDSTWAALPLGDAARPIGFALAVGFLAASIGTFGVHSWPYAVLFPWLSVLCAVVGWRAIRAEGYGPRAAIVVAAAVGASALVFHTPGLLAAALVIAVGRARGERVLEGLGALAGAIMLAQVYASMDLSLLWTSFALVGAGVGLLALRAVLLAGTQAPRADVVGVGGSVLSPTYVTDTPRGAALVLAPAAVVVAVLIGLVVDKEAIRVDGEVVIVELAPRDPRSLLQGDFLALRYKQTAGASEQRGVLVARVDERGVVTSTRVDADDGRLAANERRLRYHVKRGEPVFGAATYFVPEGTGASLERARYAELRVADDGTALLVGLRDDQLEVLHRTE